MITEFMRACRAVLFLVLALLLASNDESFAKDSASAVALLYATNPWSMVIGSDSPIFALYNDGTVIFLKHGKQNPQDANFVPYCSTKLSDKEKADLLSGLSAGLKSAKDNYQISLATDLPTNLLWMREGEKARRVVVYGDLEKGTEPMFGDTKELPPKLWSAFQKLMAFDRADGKPWLPEYLEVMLSPFQYSRDKPIEWPADWPDLMDAHTVCRGDSYSIFVPSTHLEDLRVMLKSMKETTAVQLNGKKWAMSFRFPIPDETAIRSPN